MNIVVTYGRKIVGEKRKDMTMKIKENSRFEDCTKVEFKQTKVELKLKL